MENAASAGVGWVEVGLLSLCIEGVSRWVFVEARSSTVRAIWASDWSVGRVRQKKRPTSLAIVGHWFALVSLLVSVANQNGSKSIVLSDNADHGHLVEMLK